MRKRVKKRFLVFVGFMVFGVFLGIIEDLLAVYFSTESAINLKTILIATSIAIPFACIGELIIDRKDLIPKPKLKWLQHLEVFLEFMIFGMVMGIIEDILVITIATQEPVSFSMVGIVALVTLPFAIFGEIIVDRHDWFSWARHEKHLNKV